MCLSFRFLVKTSYGKHFVIRGVSRQDAASWMFTINAVRWGLEQVLIDTAVEELLTESIAGGEAKTTESEALVIVQVHQFELKI